LRCTHRAGSQQQILIASLDMCGVEVARILFLEHHSTCAVEKLGAAAGKRTRILSDLAEQAQGQGILVDVLEPAAREMVQNKGSVDRREFIR